jgi:hypothetical protein
MRPLPPLPPSASAARWPAWFLGIPLLSGCAAFVPGSLARRPDVYDVRRVGCLEIAVRPLRDPVIAFTIGNCCPNPVGVEFRNLTVRAWSEDGTEHHPAVSDPRGELFEAVIDGHDQVNAALDFPVSEMTPRFCVDVSRLNVDQPAPNPVEMCFRVYGAGEDITADPLTLVQP